MITLDRHSPISLAQQIETGFAQLIAARTLLAGAKLPSIRQLAAQLAVSSNTVVLAYDRLVAAGLILTHGKTGFFVRAQSDVARQLPDALALEAGEEQEPVWFAQQASDQREGVLLASSGALPASWLQDAIPPAMLQRAMTRANAGMAARAPSQGLAELREQIALLLRDIGLQIDAASLMTTLGGSHAIDLICRSFLAPGDTVLVEDPGYFLMFGRLQQTGVQIVPVPRRHDGLDLAAFERACQEHRPKLLFVQTALHSPTGWSSSAVNLHQLLTLARQYQVLIAEDDVHGHFMPGHATRLAALSGLHGVIYYSSFCKALSPALRMGFIAAHADLLKVLLRNKIYAILTMPALNEYVLLEVLKTGNWRKHLDRLQRKLMLARNASVRQLSEAGVIFDQLGEAGLFLWGRMPDAVDVDALVAEAYQHKILLMRGAVFSPNLELDQHIRFNVAFCQHPRLATYLQKNLVKPD